MAVSNPIIGLDVYKNLSNGRPSVAQQLPDNNIFVELAKKTGNVSDSEKETNVEKKTYTVDNSGLHDGSNTISFNEINDEISAYLLKRMKGSEKDL